MSEEIKTPVEETTPETPVEVVKVEPTTSLEALLAYTDGNLTVDETNALLKKFGASYSLNPLKNVITDEEKAATTLGTCCAEINGWGLLDSGTGSMDKVQVKDGHLLHGMGDAYALIIIGGKMFEVKDTELVEYAKA